jgi:hypothetical protein
LLSDERSGAVTDEREGPKVTEAAIVPLAEARSLIQIEEARQTIALAREAGDVDALKEWRDRAAAVEHYARKRDGAEAAAQDAAEIKLRAEAALGRLNPPEPGGRGKTSSMMEGVSEHPRTIATWRRLGEVDERGKLDALIAELRADPDKGITTTRAGSAARGYLPKRRKRRKRRQPVTPERRAREYRDRFREHVKTAETHLRLAEAMLGDERLATVTENEAAEWGTTLRKIAQRADALRKTALGA